MRNPTIHITLSDLTAIIGHKEANRVLTEAHSQGLQLRGMAHQLTTTGKKRAAKAQANDNSEEVSLFQSVLVMARRKAKHSLVAVITPQSVEWATLKEITALASNFCDAFGFTDRMQGYMRFCELGLKLMNKKYGLNKFKYLADRIGQHEDTLRAVRTDPAPDFTAHLAAAYAKAVQDNAHVTLNIDTDSLDYAHFVWASESARNCAATPTDWVLAQFDGLAFLNRVPELAQLHSEGSASRYTQYIAAKAVTVTEAPKAASPEINDYFSKLALLEQ